MRRLFAALTTLALAAAVGPLPAALAAPVPLHPQGSRDRGAHVHSATPAGAKTNGQWIVGLKQPSRTSVRSLSATARTLGATAAVTNTHFIVVTPPKGAAAPRTIATLRRNPAVRYVEPVYVHHITGSPAALTARATSARTTGSLSMVPNDPFYMPSTGLTQWWLPKVFAPQAWDVTRGSGTTIAIVDTGVDYDQPDLAGRIDTVNAYNEVDPGAQPRDDYPEGHGTHVAGIAAATTNNGYGVAGMANEATVLPIKVGDADGTILTSWSSDGIIRAADAGADVINMSFGGDYTQAEADAVNYALSKGCVLVAAAGNDGSSQVSYPAAFPGVIGVAATNSSNHRAFYSSYGWPVDVAAPGGEPYWPGYGGDGKEILSLGRTDLGLVTNAMSGTSMASPVVAGAAALVKARRPSWDNWMIARQLWDTAQPHGPYKWDPYVGDGIVDAAAALRFRQLGLGGGDRYATSVLASRSGFPYGADHVIVATGRTYPDALGAGALAGAYSCPILLVPSTGTLSKSITGEIKRLGASRAVVLGGYGAVSAGVETQLLNVLRLDASGKRKTIRIAGKNRYETAMAAAKAAKAEVVAHGYEWNRRAYLVTGESFGDAVLASPLAYWEGSPVLLTPSASLGWQAINALNAIGVDEVVIIGDETRVPTAIEDELHAALGTGLTITRVGAEAGTAQSLAVADYGIKKLGLRWDRVGFASADSFADALSAGPVQGADGSFLLLDPTGASLAASVAAEVPGHASDVSTVKYFGGTGVVPTTLRQQVYELLNP